MHSYGGAPGSEAVAGLSKKERQARGKKGGVVRLVYLAAMALEEGFELLRGERTPAPFVEEVVSFVVISLVLGRYRQGKRCR